VDPRIISGGERRDARLGRVLRSPSAPVLLAAVALAAALLRWYLQASHNVYTALVKRFYIPDPDLQWRVSTQHPIWLGLDACAVIAAVTCGLAIAAIVIRRRERARQVRATILRVAAWMGAVASVAIPAAAFASGAGPLNARDTLPATEAVLIESGIEGSLDAPAGTYSIVTHAGTSVTAHLSAGGEPFDARFATVTGAWQGDPRNLSRPMHADIAVEVAAVDTGIKERSKHAREGYLHADQFPRITVVIDRVTAVRANGPHEIAFRAPCTVHLMGRAHALDITGTLLKPDAAALARLGLAGDILLVQADFALAIDETALADNAGDFDGNRIPIHVSLVLRRD
jgi:polyisoprenoid-binding protein YceI